ncbi:unnamed protein product, partial [Amoebophrya sp. A25]
RSLVYTAPTSGGKSLVADILMMRRLLYQGKRALVNDEFFHYLKSPFVSICNEKVTALQRVWGEIVRVQGFFGPNQSGNWHPSVDVAVCTYEKANVLISKWIEEDTLGQIGTLAPITDELHMVSDPDRGYILELILTKVRLYQRRYEKLKALAARTNRDMEILDIIGLSATLPDVPTIAQWLGAGLYETKFRPVSLGYKVQFNKRVYSFDGRKALDLLFQRDTDGVSTCIFEAMCKNESTLSFCSSKNWCESQALKIAENIQSRVAAGRLLFARRRVLLNKLRKCAAGLDDTLAQTIPFGVAYHHAGLLVEERAILEHAFRERTILTFCCTTTLAAGVNLPCRRDALSNLLRSTRTGPATVELSRFLQIVGRAGRAGYDDAGECIVWAQDKRELKVVTELLTGTLPPLESALTG